ncbi:tetratricopeptide repeat protein [Mycobacterium intracellulare]|uniref:tetratricopeptide repeat protein n=1 Tax=Mycobacterium intracellulare TaxID=1767 RepID=UPI00137B2F9D|nr:sel1 repeat family protein [Mycobacterium intracellulare]
MVAATASVLAALKAAGLAAGKGGATAVGSEVVKGAWRRFFNGRTKAAADVMVMAVIRTIEESTSESRAADVDWWTRAGQQLIKPFTQTGVADNVLRNVVSYPANTDGACHTLIAALELAGKNFHELASDLDFDADQFLSSFPQIVLDELLLAAAEQDSPLLQLAQLASLRQLAANRESSDAPAELETLADLVEVLDGQHLPLVRSLNPYELGTTPSTFGNAQTYGQCDPYVRRARDNDIASALAASLVTHQLVLLIGPSKAGKTRTAFEAIREHFPDALLLSPQPGAFGRLVADPRIAASTDTIVVWLDDLERLISHADPLRPALLSQLTSRTGRTIVLATLRREQRDRLRQGGELLRDTRLLLDHAITINIDPLTSEDPEEQAAANRAYPGQNLEFGLAARLAGAPSLLQRYDDARHADPLRHSVIRVSIDWVRVGRPDPIPDANLAALARDAIEIQRPDLDATDQQVAEAIKNSRTPPEGSGRVAALTVHRLPDGTRGYRPFDYLVAADDGQGHPLRPIPERFWATVLNNAPPVAAFAVGFAAFQRGNIRAATMASRQAAEAGIISAMFNLGVLFADHQDAEDLPAARKWYEKAAAAGDVNAMVNSESCWPLGGTRRTRRPPAACTSGRRPRETSTRWSTLECYLPTYSSLRIQPLPPIGICLPPPEATLTR